MPMGNPRNEQLAAHFGEGLHREGTMMALVGCAVVLMIVLVGVIVMRALNQGRDVKAGLKIPFAMFFFSGLPVW